MAAVLYKVLGLLCVLWINSPLARPALLKSSISYTVNEASSINMFVGDVGKDSEAKTGLSPQQKATLRFAILPSSRRGNNLFKIDALSGRLTVAEDIDYDNPSLCSAAPCFVKLQVNTSKYVCANS